MLENSLTFSGYSVKDKSAAKEFYANLGLTVEQNEMGLALHLLGGNEVFLYEKLDHQPATFTVLNFQVDNIDTAIDELVARGIVFEKYNDPNLPQDEKGVLRGRSVQMGPDITWFKDPSDNILSILQG